MYSSHIQYTALSIVYSILTNRDGAVGTEVCSACVPGPCNRLGAKRENEQ